MPATGVSIAATPAPGNSATGPAASGPAGLPEHEVPPMQAAQAQAASEGGGYPESSTTRVAATDAAAIGAPGQAAVADDAAGLTAEVEAAGFLHTGEPAERDVVEGDFVEGDVFREDDARGQPSAGSGEESRAAAGTEAAGALGASGDAGRADGDVGGAGSGASGGAGQHDWAGGAGGNASSAGSGAADGRGDQDQARNAPASGYRPYSRAVPVGRGATWIAEGFGLFKRAPGPWAGLMAVCFVLLLASAVIPYVGQIALLLLSPVFGGGLMLGCRALDRGEPLQLRHLFAGFDRHAGALVLIGVWLLAGTLAIAAAVAVGSGMSIMTAYGGGGAAGRTASLTIFILAVLGLVLLCLLNMAVWYAPALVVFRGMGALGAMRKSLIACLRNLAPLSLHGLLLLALGVLASLPAGLGWLVLGPVMLGALYQSYKEIFGADPAP